MYKTELFFQNTVEQKSAGISKGQITIALHITLLERAVAEENIAENGADVYCFLWRRYICWLFLGMCIWRRDSRLLNSYATTETKKNHAIASARFWLKINSRKIAGFSPSIDKLDVSLSWSYVSYLLKIFVKKIFREYKLSILIRKILFVK